MLRQRLLLRKWLKDKIMKKPKIVFLCHFSNPEIRESLELKKYSFRRILGNLLKKELFHYQDFAIWVTDYIVEFEKNNDFEIHIVSPHKGMKQRVTSYERNNVYYHFFKSDSTLCYDWLNARWRIEEKNNYISNRRKIEGIILDIEPDIVLLCGAENPYYSIGVLDIKDKPIYVILQTLLNDTKRIEMGVGSLYRRKIELEIFKHANYFCTSNEKEIKTIKEHNSKAIMLPAGFPTHRPYVKSSKEKEYDFVFFSRIISVNKGIEDLLRSIAAVKKCKRNVSLNIIGGCDLEYRKKLDSIISEYEIQNNVHFAGFYDNINETYSNVAKARIAVLPSITAGLNSTVRESMLMGLPTICYETSAIIHINKEQQCLIVAKMEDIQDLSVKMRWALDNPQQVQRIALNASNYANNYFSNKSIVDRLLQNCKQILEETRIYSSR